MAIAAALTSVGLGACGDNGSTEKSEVELELVSASFPARQSLANQETMRIVVRNPSDREVAQVTATVSPGKPGLTGSGFNRNTGGALASDPSRAVWIVDKAPVNGVTADPAVTRLGPIQPGKELAFTWKVTPVQTGPYRIRWTVGGSMDGNVTVTDQQGKPIAGTFNVLITANTPKRR